MIYETYQQLALRVRQWCRTLPGDIVAVAGVPRAGQIVAGMLAAERNLHLIQLEDILQGRKPWEFELRRACPAKNGDKVLVVDDTVATGNKFRELKSQLQGRGNLVYGAVYGKHQGLHEVDFCAVPVGDIDHVFEWNWNHHWFVEQFMFDLDGVLCTDWPHLHEEGELVDAYRQHVADARCLMVPSFTIGAIVTARLEKHRPQTEAWLQKYGIRFRELHMAPYDTPAERSQNGGFAERKAAIYKSRSDIRLFVESCHHQAETIARITGKPVLSWPRNEMLNGAAL